jgi:hypothetical protein
MAITPKAGCSVNKLVSQKSPHQEVLDSASFAAIPKPNKNVRFLKPNKCDLLPIYLNTLPPYIKLKKILVYENFYLYIRRASVAGLACRHAPQHQAAPRQSALSVTLCSPTC